MSFALYLIGFAIAIGGVMYGAHLMHVPTAWAVAVAILLAGIGIVKGVRATRPKDPA